MRKGIKDIFNVNFKSSPGVMLVLSSLECMFPCIKRIQLPGACGSALASWTLWKEKSEFTCLANQQCLSVTKKIKIKLNNQTSRLEKRTHRPEVYCILKEVSVPSLHPFLCEHPSISCIYKVKDSTGPEDLIFPHPFSKSIQKVARWRSWYYCCLTALGSPVQIGLIFVHDLYACVSSGFLVSSHLTGYAKLTQCVWARCHMMDWCHSRVHF